MSVYPEGSLVSRGAHLSDEEPRPLYRYRLTRFWTQGEHSRRGVPLPYVMLNPSTADALEDDATIRKCVGFATRLGFHGIAVWNLYAFRTRDPKVLYAAKRDGVDIVGPENDRRLRNMLVWAYHMEVPVIAAWGGDAKPERIAEVLEFPHATEVLRVLGFTSKGVPRHPVMLGYEGIGDPTTLPRLIA